MSLALLFATQLFFRGIAVRSECLYSAHLGFAVQSQSPTEAGNSIVTFYDPTVQPRKSVLVPKGFRVIGVTNSDELVLSQEVDYYANVGVTQNGKAHPLDKGAPDDYLDYKNGWFIRQFGPGLLGYSATEGYRDFGQIYGFDRYAVSRSGLMAVWRLSSGVPRIETRTGIGSERVLPLNAEIVLYGFDYSCCVVADRQFICLLDLRSKVKTSGLPVLFSGDSGKDSDTLESILCAISLVSGKVTPIAVIRTLGGNVNVPDPGNPRSIVAVDDHTIAVRSPYKVWIIQLPQ